MPDERKKILEVRHLKQYFNVGKKDEVREIGRAHV